LREIAYINEALSIFRAIGRQEHRGCILGPLGVPILALASKGRQKYLELSLSILEQIQSPQAETARPKLSQFENV
jgi:hypothetical protein